MVTKEARPTTTTYPIAVVIVTHNRVERVAHSVYSVFSQQFSEPFELVLVDAASTDGTQARLHELAQQAPSHVLVRVVDEYTGGASNARNVGWRTASAEVIAFLDDDAEADPNWLTRARRQFSDHRRIQALAGRTEIRWVEGYPSDLHAIATAQFVALDYGDQVRRVRYPRAPIGPNMIVRRIALESSGGFDPDLGPAPGRATVGEESDLSLRIERAGGHILYDPEIKVRHLVEAGRINDDYLASRARIHGSSRALVDRRHFGWLRTPHQLVRLLRGLVRVLYRRRYTIVERLDFVYGAAYFRSLLGMGPANDRKR